MPGKNTYKDQIKEITDSIERHIQELFNSERYRQYLRTMGQFHRYSFNNSMLIFAQRPNATRVASFSKWKQLGRSVMKGEKGLRILAPSPYNKTVSRIKRDPNTGKTVMDADPRRFPSSLSRWTRAWTATSTRRHRTSQSARA